MTNIMYVLLLLATTITALVLQYQEYTLNARNKWDGDDYCQGDPQGDCSGGSDAIQCALPSLHAARRRSTLTRRASVRYRLCDSEACSGQFATYRVRARPRLPGARLLAPRACPFCPARSCPSP